MEFYINQGATLPLLKMQLNYDGKSSLDEFNRMIAESNIFFSMKKVDDGLFKILNKPCGVTNKIFIEPNSPTEYYIYYKFTQRDTDTDGRYEGEFLIRTDSGIIILPITEKLFINIGENFVID
jgi:hypothetical protein